MPFSINFMSIILGCPETQSFVACASPQTSIRHAHTLERDQIADKGPHQSAANAHSSAQYFNVAVYKQLTLCCC